MDFDPGGPAWRLSAQVAELADDVRGLAGSAQAAAGVDWSSVAAEAFRRALLEDSAAVLQAAGRLDEAAAAVRRHAHAVEVVLAELGELGRWIAAVRAWR